MGTLLGVRADGDSLLVKVRLDNNLEQDVPIQNLAPAGQDRVLALMVPAARINGTKIPALKFSASKKTESGTIATAAVPIRHPSSSATPCTRFRC